jgi:histidine triad (HIT) family protein
MCIFCDIAEGKAPASIVYKDEVCIAFMDLHQVNPGHVLVIPQHHIVTIDQLSPNLTATLFQVVVKLTQAVKKAFSPDGITILQSNGKAAFQEVPHLHIHIMPRMHHDGLVRFYTKGAPTVSSRIELDDMARKIRNRYE